MLKQRLGPAHRPIGPRACPGLAACAGALSRLPAGRAARPVISGAIAPGTGEGGEGASTRVADEGLNGSVPGYRIESNGAPAGALEAGTSNASSPSGSPEPPLAAAPDQGGVPHRWKLVAMMAVAFVLCNMDKVNMSVAVIPMAHDLGWSATDRGLVSSSFFWGYSLTQVPAGWISTKIGGAKVLMAGVALWSFGTLIAPPAAHAGLWALCASRVLVGLGEGFAPSAATSVLARQVPSTERSRAVTTVWGGLDVGSAVGLLLSGPLIRMYGWPSVFYLFAVLGLVWCVIWPLFNPELEDPAVRAEHKAEKLSGIVRVPRLPVGADAGSSAGASEAILDARNAAGSMDEYDEEPFMSPAVAHSKAGLGGAIGISSSSGAGGGGDGGAAAAGQDPKQRRQQAKAAAAAAAAAADSVPWGAFLTSMPVIAVTVAHFCYNWGYYTLLAWLPSYFELALGLNVQESSFLTLIPYVAMVLMTPVVGPVADGLIKRGWSLTLVRKLSQGIAFVGPAACMVACAVLTPAAGAGAGAAAAASGAQTAALVLLLSLGFALGAWSRAGLYCNHQDLSPKYASALLGITNTAGALPGVLGVTSAGYLLDATGSWALALFFPTAACQLFGAAFYGIFASSERQPWS